MTAAQGQWPRLVTAYVRAVPEQMDDVGARLGLSGEPLALFRHALCEIEVKMSVNEDGTYKILEVKG